ncbi:MAG: hypothetical protein AAF628_21755 [Planctomycetota bacterium]
MQYNDLDTRLRSGPSQDDIWIFRAKLGFGVTATEVPTSPPGSDGVEIRIIVGGSASTSCSPAEAVIWKKVLLPGDLIDVRAPLGSHWTSRSSAYFAIEVAPLGHNARDWFIVDNPRLVPPDAEKYLYGAGEFANAGVYQVLGTAWTPLPATWSALSQSWASGGAAQVPANELVSCNLELDGGNYGPDKTLVVQPPANPAAFTEVRYDMLNLDRQLDWFLTARVSLDHRQMHGGSSSNGALFEVTVAADDEYGTNQWAHLAQVSLAYGDSREVHVPLGVWPHRENFVLALDGRSNGSATDDRILIENAFLYGLPPTDGLEHVAHFGFYDYELEDPTYLSSPPSAPRFANMDPVSNTVMLCPYFPQSHAIRSRALKRRERSVRKDFSGSCPSSSATLP